MSPKIPLRTWLLSLLAILVTRGANLAMAEDSLQAAPTPLPAYLEEQPCNDLLSDPLFRALKPQERQHLALTAAESVQIPKVAKAILNGNYADPVFDFSETRTTVRVAVEAYRQNLISKQQLVTQIIRWEALHEYRPKDQNSIKPLPIFNPDGSPSDILQNRLLNMPPLIGRRELRAQLETQLRALPASEQVMWEYTTPSSTPFRPHLQGSTFFSDFFGGFKVERDSRLYIATVRLPSFGIIQTFFDVVFDESRMQLIPQLGQTDAREVRKGILEGGRVVSLSLPDLDGVLDAHDRMGRLVSTAHDLTHAFEAGFLPYPYRRVLMRFYKVLEDFQRTAKGPKSLVSLHGDNFYSFPLRQPLNLSGQREPITRFAIRRSLLTKEFKTTPLERVLDKLLDLNVYEHTLYSADDFVVELERAQQGNSGYFFNRDFGNHDRRFENPPRFYYLDGLVYTTPSFSGPDAAINHEMRDTLLILMLDIHQNPDIYRSLGLDPTELIRAIDDPSVTALAPTTR